MKQHFVIIGMTGIEKTYLELELQSRYGFYPWPKYTDRDLLREDEKDDSNIVQVTTTKFQSMIPEFLFTTTFLNYNYGWKRQDFTNHQDKNITLSMLPDNLTEFMVKVPGFLPVMLYIDYADFAFVENRIKQRENYDNLPPDQQKLVNEKIRERLISAKYDLERFSFYQNMVNRHGGGIFAIKDDSTIDKEVIPFILSNLEAKNRRTMMSVVNKYR